MTSPDRPLTGFQNNFTEMFSYDPFPKMLKWFCFEEQNGHQSLIKKKKGVDCHASINNLLQRHLLNGLMDFEIILQYLVCVGV